MLLWAIRPSEPKVALTEVQEEHIRSLTVGMGLKPLCLVAPFFGQTSNNILTIGKLLKLVHEEGKNRTVGLDTEWTKWYQLHFDPRSDVILSYLPSGDCEKTYDGKSAFLSPGWDVTHLVDFLPKAKYIREAESILQSWPHGKDFISVHRRDLDGTCTFFAKCAKMKKKKCMYQRDPKLKCSAEMRLQACKYEHDTIPNPLGLPIVLFTDGQVPEKDNTFPLRFNSSTSLLVEMWLMVNSRVHWGNPRSTLDITVASWRHGLGMEPKACYDDPQKIVFVA